MVLDKILTRKKSFIIISNLKEIEQKVVANREIDFSVKKEQLNLYQFSNHRSLGVGSLNGFSQPISTNALFKPIDERNLQVELYTKTRTDLVLSTFLMLCVEILILYYQVFQKEPIPLVLNIFVFPITPIWFWYIFKDQEEVLQNKVEKFIRLKTGNW
jgi:hypothetical protein